ncbi:glutathione peroxidase [Aliidiomarina sanyensis]|uniref:Glutathione peroxidase n=1 Tax=Aliidiomarina sanyensis TaxID=1249555 RepID=A0A432WRU8_9GAMM|nr:glutathione peroxidase [Aliidiomarina sanyensis]RUO36495.1 glutathione peroxidase [Aliidiomarina sanyensis]
MRITHFERTERLQVKLRLIIQLTLIVTLSTFVTLLNLKDASAGEKVETRNAPNCAPIFQHQLRALHSEEIHDLCSLTAGKAVLVVNTASRCGFTRQFTELEALFATYQESDVMVLGFPSNSFRQEHDDEEATADVCFRNFGVTFPMMATTSVTGDDAHPVFQALAEMTGDAPRWNFHKYLVNKDGTEAIAFPSAVSPMDSAVIYALETFLEESSSG